VFVTEQLLVGAAEVVVTPPLGISMAGYYEDRKADDVHDDLFAHALVFECGGEAAAVVVCDLIGLSPEVTGPARDAIRARTGVPPERVMVCCTHTHTGPVIATRKVWFGDPDPVYVDVLTRKIADAAQLAWQRRQQAALRAGKGRAEGIAFNRRYWMKDGRLLTNPPFQSPDIVRPAGPIDPEVSVLLASDAGGTPLALLSNYALHPDQVGGTALGADHEGAERRLLRRVLGEGVTVLCPNGCCGDINHFDVSKPWPQQGQRCADRSGSVLAGAVLQALPDLAAVAAAPLRGGSRAVAIGLRLPTAEEVAWAEEVVNRPLHGFDDAGIDVVKAHRIQRLARAGEASIEAEVTAIVCGDLAIVGLPGECFVELGLEVKRRSPFRHTIVCELCNASIGYVPTRKAYDEGGYEATSTPLQPGTGESLVEAAVALLEGAAGGGR
jgi:neutral ceramidase